MIEFLNDLGKNILDHTHLRPGCHTDLEALDARVFEELASMNGESLRSLGNATNWALTGKEAAIQIAVNRAVEGEDDFNEVLEAMLA